MLAVVGLIAVLSLRDGFSGDQALFLIFSKAIDNGAVLYKDVWDIKQPAIFIFYLAAGKLFGFTEIGIHLFEIIYWLVFSILMILGLRNYFKNQIYVLLTPLFTVGIFYSVSGSLHLTQVESLVCFPLFLSLWFCQKFLENPDKKSLLFLSGLSGGIVLMFKLMLIIVLFAFWSGLLVYCYFLIFNRDAKQHIVPAGIILIGLIIPIALVIVYFAANDALFDLWYTTFVYPFNAVNTITTMEDRNGVLIDGFTWFFKSYFPVISFGLLFVLLNAPSFLIAWRQKRGSSLHRRDFFFLGLFVWSLSGFAVILIQRLSWWQYHYTLLMLPFGILAVKCVECLFESIKASRKRHLKTPAYTAVILLIMISFIPTARGLAHKIRQFNRTELIRIGNREVLITGSALGDYMSISKDTEFLKTETPKPSIFVVSNPLYYYLSDSSPVFASNGAMTDMFTNFEWNRLNREMLEKPPKYVFIETRFMPPVRKEALLRVNTIEDPTFLNTMNNNYSIHVTGDRGSFYRLKEAID